MKSKNLFLLSLIVLLFLNSVKAQCWIVPKTNADAVLDGVPSYNFKYDAGSNAEGGFTFETYTTTPETFNNPQIKNWNTLVFNLKNTITLTGNFSFPDNARLYLNGNMNIESLKIYPGDTIFVKGNLGVTYFEIPSSYNPNNLRPIIFLSDTNSTFSVGGQNYKVGQTSVNSYIYEGSNPQQYTYSVKIIDCDYVASPPPDTSAPKITSFQISHPLGGGLSLSWEIENKEVVSKIVVEASTDNTTWDDILDLTSDKTGVFFPDTKAAAISWVILLLGLGVFVKSRKKAMTIIGIFFMSITTSLFFSCSKGSSTVEQTTTSEQGTKNYNYYRIKVVETNGKISYSNSIKA